ncbi:MAG: DUF1501 domain-containing protein [Burkholderiales bacterium]|nr:DUF1501 domain-containing protein [Burkholderiales bacterium]MDE2627547.1 DUF1501 domain-containing protein [Burkholderiales bacterium]
MNLPVNTRRRRLLGAALGAGTLAPWSTLSFAAGAAHDAVADRRFVFVILRGALDGLSAVPALGDPDFAAARGALGQFGAAPLALDTTFALHPNLAQLHAMYGRGELAVVHAVGQPWRDRSHFDAQQVLESGGVRPYELATGWLGRALGAQRSKGLALNTAVPLVLRGPGVVDTWAPSALPDPGADLVARLDRMYVNDAALATALERAKALHFGAAMPADMAGGGMGGAAAGRAGGFVVLAQRAAEFLAEPNGPQAAVLEMTGWDTHANQANPNGPLANYLRQLDTGLAALRDGLLASGTWSRTVVVVATEFGRTVAINGTLGTDHGSGGAAFVLGGAVNGGRVIADWPGLAARDRFEGRDLKVTTDLRAVLKGVLADHLQVPAQRLDTEVFPGSAAVKGIALLKA